MSAAIQAVAEGDHSSSSNATRLEFMTGASEAAAEKMTLTSAGILNTTKLGVITDHDLGAGIHIRTADSGGTVDAAADELVIEGSGATGLSIFTANDTSGQIYFGDDGAAKQGRVVYDHPTDAMSLYTANTVGFKIDSAGHITKPLQPAAMYTANNGSNFTGDGTQGTVGQTAGMGLTERFDNNADSTDGIFTAPVTGRYLIVGQVWVEGIASNHDDITIVMETSNRSYYVAFDPHEMGRASADSMGTSISAFADMDANDTHKLKISVGGGSKVVDLVDLTTLGITLLC